MSDITWRDACPHKPGPDDDECSACDAAMMEDARYYYALYQGEKAAGLVPALTEDEVRDAYRDDTAKRTSLLRRMGAL